LFCLLFFLKKIKGVWKTVTGEKKERKRKEKEREKEKKKILLSVSSSISQLSPSLVAPEPELPWLLEINKSLSTLSLCFCLFVCVYEWIENQK